MTFERLIETFKSNKTEDGFEIEYLSEYWTDFRYNKIKWGSKQNYVVIEFPFVHEEKIKINEDGTRYSYVSPNQNISIPTDTQKKALEYLLLNEKKLGDILVDKIFQGYNRLRIEYGEPEDSSFMPRLNKSGELVKYIELTRIHILPNNKDNHSFIGFYFGGCSWDEEHGLGILTWKDKVVKVGQIEDAYDLGFKM